MQINKITSINFGANPINKNIAKEITQLAKSTEIFLDTTIMPTQNAEKVFKPQTIPFYKYLPIRDVAKPQAPVTYKYVSASMNISK